MALKRSEFKNNRNHFIGVMAKNEKGEMKGIAVAPEGTIWLDEEEQIATANAPRNDGDNPFINGDLTLITPATVVANRRPIGFSEDAPNPEQATAAREPEPAPPAGDPAGDGGGGAEGSQEPAAPEPEGGGGDDPGKAPEEPQGGAQAAGEGKPETPAPVGRRNPSTAEQERSAAEAAKRAQKGSTPPPAADKATAAKAEGGPPEMTGSAPKPGGEAATGQRQPTEEVGTPEAVEKS